MSSNTIARVNVWLTLSGSGFRLVIQRAGKREQIDPEKLQEKYDPFSWQNIKRRYSMYFLPELIIEEIMKRSSEKERKKLHAILESIESKKEVFKEVDERMRRQLRGIKKRFDV